LHTAIYDPVRDHMVVFGGQDNSARFNDVWALSLAGNPAWTLLIRPASPPSGRAAHAAIYDPVRDRMVVFGGDDAADLLNDVWALSLAGSPVWTQLAPTGSPPPARDLTTAIYDPVRDRMVVFGGQAYGFPGGAYILNDVWALSLTGVPAWTQLAPAGSPPPVRALPAAIYDPVRDRMVVFGGDGESSPVNDVWALSLAGSPSWTMLTPSGPPPPARFGHTAVYDPVRDRMLVFAGYPSHYYGGAIALDDVWALSLAGSPAWIPLVPAGTPPPARHSHTAIYDPVRDRMIVFGGEDDTSPFVNDAWALSLAGNPAWLSLALAGSPPCPRAAHTAIYDPVRDRMLVFGGDDVTGAFLNDAWSLAWGTSVSVPGDADAVAHRFELAPPRPNPSRGETVVAFELPAPARVVIDVFDTQGRWVKRLADESFTAGRHASTWRGDDEGGHPLGSGVYFIRMRAGAFQAARRTVRVR